MIEVKKIGPVIYTTSQPVRAIYSGSTRTMADYAPAAQGVVAMTSDLDITLTIPSGCTKVNTRWDLSGEATDNAAAIGFVVYRSVNGGAYAILPNSRDGSSNYYSVICAAPLDLQAGVSPSTFPVVINDDSPPASGSTVIYRLYCANTSAGTAESFYSNRARTAPASAIETCLTTFVGMCI